MKYGTKEYFDYIEQINIDAKPAGLYFTKRPYVASGAKVNA